MTDGHSFKCVRLKNDDEQRRKIKTDGEDPESYEETVRWRSKGMKEPERLRLGKRLYPESRPIQYIVT